MEDYGEKKKPDKEAERTENESNMDSVYNKGKYCNEKPHRIVFYGSGKKQRDENQEKRNEFYSGI